MLFISQEEETPYAFYVNGKEILDDLDSILRKEKVSTEAAIQIIYQPQAVFKVMIISPLCSVL